MAFYQYLKKYISYFGEGVYRTRSADQKNLRQFSTRTKIFELSFFPYYIKKWNNLSEEPKPTVQFKMKIISFIRPKENSIFKIHDTNGISY